MFGMARFSTLFLALAIASPALYAAFVEHTLDPTTALLRLLIAVPVAAIMLGVVRAVTRDYGKERRRRADTRADEPVRAEAVTGEPVAQRRTTDNEPG
jgi:peptidoglycan/LPS O-acetylase OafA/YrhL